MTVRCCSSYPSRPLREKNFADQRAAAPAPPKPTIIHQFCPPSSLLRPCNPLALLSPLFFFSLTSACFTKSSKNLWMFSSARTSWLNQIFEFFTFLELQREWIYNYRIDSNWSSPRSINFFFCIFQLGINWCSDGDFRKIRQKIILNFRAPQNDIFLPFKPFNLMSRDWNYCPRDSFIS